MVSAALLVLSACTSDDGEAAPSVSASPIPELAGPPVKIGIIGNFSQATPLGNAQPELVSAAQAAVDAVNVAGGIKGKRLELVSCDERGDANRATRCARQFVDDGVIATVGDGTINAEQFNPVLSEAKIVRIGPLAVGVTEFTAPNNYLLTGGVVTLFAGVILLSAEVGAKSVAIVAGATPQTASIEGLLKPTMERARVEYKGLIQTPQGTTDFSPYVNQAKKSGAEVIVSVLNPSDLSQFIRTSSQLGAEYKIGAAESTLETSALESLGDLTEGMLLAGAYPTVNATGFKTIDRFNDEMDQRAARGDESAAKEKRGIVLEAWLSVHAFAKVAGTVDGTVTREAFTAALAAAKNVNLGDVTPPWTPSKTGKTIPRVSNGDGYFLVVKDQQKTLYKRERVHILD